MSKSIQVAFLALLLSFSMKLQGGLARSDTDIESYRQLARQSQFDCVIQLDERGSSATGVLVAAKWILTAAHVAESPGDPFFGGQLYHRVQTVFHPQWRSPANNEEWLEDLVKGTDLALIELDRPVTNIAAARRYRGDDEINNLATLVGWGYVGTLETGPLNPEQQEKIAGRNVIEDTPGITLGSFIPRFTDRVLVYDADNPLDPSESTLGSSEALPLEYFASDQDSGSGLFIQENGEWYLAGIDKAGGHPLTGEQDQSSGVFGFVEIYARISFSNEWIDSVLPENAYDCDGDGLGDRWEINHFGDLTEETGDSDPDFDGFSNSEEFAFGTDPMDRSSRFFTYIFQSNSSETNFAFGPIHRDRIYNIENSTDLKSESWLPHSEYRSDSSKNHHTLNIYNAGDHFFLRVKVSQQVLP